jgi:hypothetical protein
MALIDRSIPLEWQGLARAGASIAVGSGRRPSASFEFAG